MKVTLGEPVDLSEMPATPQHKAERPWTKEQMWTLPRDKAIPATVDTKVDATSLAALWRDDVRRVLPNCIGFTRTSLRDGQYCVHLAIRDKVTDA